MVSILELQDQLVASIEKLDKSVVSIDTTLRNFSFGAMPLEGQGSGIIIDSRGYVVSNNHVVDGSPNVRVHLRDGNSYDGRVIGHDLATDIALIKVKSFETLPSAALGNSDMLKVGQFSLAIGNALGLPGGSTVSLGVIGALGRPLPWAEFIFEGLIQTDAAINPGNSGGPLADVNGNVIGINTAMVPNAQGVGFAIPINAVKRVVDQIFSNGRVVRPWLGISGINLTAQIARRYGLPLENGVLIVDLIRDGPAHEIGLRSGDVIVRVADQEVRHMKDLLVSLSKLEIGSIVKLEFNRMGVKRLTTLKVLEIPKAVQNYQMTN